MLFGSICVMRKMEIVETALRFVEKINAGDVDGIALLMTENHRFIDSLGNLITGRDEMKKGWEIYLRTVPDYRIEVEESFKNGNSVMLFGKASGTYSPDGKVHPEYAWSTLSVWIAKVEDGLVSEWRVYADNEPIRRHMRDAST